MSHHKNYAFVLFHYIALQVLALIFKPRETNVHTPLTKLCLVLRSKLAPCKGIQESHWILDCTLWIPDSMHWTLVFVSGIPDSLSCIPDCKAQDSGFHKQKFPRFQNPDSLTWSRVQMVDSVECCEVKRGAKNKQKQPRESEQLD